MDSMKGVTTVVTGGSTGIGAAVARRFAREGATVAILDVNSVAATGTVATVMDSGGDAFFEACDVSQHSEVNRAIAAVVGRSGPIHALVNCAGVVDFADFLDIEPDKWDRVLAVNLRGSFLVSQAVARNMAKHGGGAIVNIASINGHVAEPGSTSYNASKAAIHAMTRTAAVELAPFGIRVNSVSPGYVDTAMAVSVFDAEIVELLRTDFKRVPLKRMLTVDEIAGVCRFLVSDESSAITGSDFIVDGGLMANAYIAETVLSA